MKLKDFLKTLNRMARDKPEYNDLEVVYSTDDEGNDYHKVYMTGMTARFKNLKDSSLELIDEEIENEEGDIPVIPNAIIIN